MTGLYKGFGQDRVVCRNGHFSHGLNGTQHIEVPLEELFVVLVGACGGSGLESLGDGSLILAVSRIGNILGHAAEGIFHQVVLSLVLRYEHRGKEFHGPGSGLRNVGHRTVESGCILGRHFGYDIGHDGLHRPLAGILSQDQREGQED